MLQALTNTLYGYSGSIGTSNKVAAFDLDWTLVRPIKGRFLKDSNDWAWLPNRISAIRKYYDDNYTIVIFTNQGYKNKKEAVDRVNNILTSLIKFKIEPWVFAATGHDSYRKPNIGMWELFNQYVPNIDKGNSFYVGDAAGRPQDHSDSDLIFAQNVQIVFHTPEEFFLNNQVYIPATQTMFIFMGMAGAGKTTFYDLNLKHLGWVHVNQDNLGSQAKMLRTIRIALQAGQSVAIDATNPSFGKRKEYVDLAIEYQIPTLIIYFVRNGYEWNKLRSNKVPAVAYNYYFKELVEPNLELDRVPVIEIF